MKRVIFTIVAIVLFCMSTFAQSKSINVLFIGNSYTYYHDMPEMLKQLANGVSGNDKLTINYTTFTPGGCTLAKHLKNTELVAALKQEKWDYVIVQEQSVAPSLHSRTVARKTYPCAREICQLARVGNRDVKIIFYMTWGHKDGSNSPEEGYPLIDTYEGMQTRLISSYLEMTYDNSAWCAPVGMAWQQIRRERPDLSLYMPDRFHPSLAGSYLAANVILATILQTEFQSTYLGGLDEEQAIYLQQTGQATLLNNKHICNIKE
jgi:hypothetical protein